MGTAVEYYEPEEVAEALADFNEAALGINRLYNGRKYLCLLMMLGTTALACSWSLQQDYFTGLSPAQRYPLLLAVLFAFIFLLPLTGWLWIAADAAANVGFFTANLSAIKFRPGMFLDLRAPKYFRNISDRVVYSTLLPEWRQCMRGGYYGSRNLSRQMITIRACVSAYFRECIVAGILASRLFDGICIILLWAACIPAPFGLILIKLTESGRPETADLGMIIGGACLAICLNAAWLLDLYFHARLRDLFNAMQEHFASMPNSGVPTRPAQDAGHTEADWELEQNSLYDKSGWS